MNMQFGNRFRCYPTAAQEQILLQWIGCQRFIYNAKVREDRYFRRFARKSMQHSGQPAPIDQQYAQFKTELTPWLCCAACGHVHQDYRVSQSRFVCLSCGNIDPADHNAAKVIALWGFGGG